MRMWRPSPVLQGTPSRSVKRCSDAAKGIITSTTAEFSSLALGADWREKRDVKKWEVGRAKKIKTTRVVKKLKAKHVKKQGSSMHACKGRVE
jgi:hypothetical protein